MEGAAALDALLQAAAKIFAQELKRSMDFVARWGGEEFVALLTDTDWGGALSIAERLRMSIESAVVPLADGRTTGITVSIGVNSCVPSSWDAMGDFVHRADEALYAAKHQGRNRVCRYGDN
jgi:diguanylate cyclase (GGDEF)-like protein